jgi:protein phosphatase
VDPVVVIIVLVPAAVAAWAAWRFFTRPVEAHAAPPPSAPPSEPEPERVDGTDRPAPPTTPPPVEAVMPPKIYDQEDDYELDLTHVGEIVRFVTPTDDDDEVDVDEAAQIERIVHDEEAADDEPTRADAFFLVHAIGQTDRGLRRQRNEDSLLVVNDKQLYVVADGMGGHRGGERASELAVAVIEEAFMSGKFTGPQFATLPTQAAELARAIHMSNRAIFAEAREDKRLEGMGTTVCAARFSPKKKRLYIGHVGDSRCYRLRDGRLEQITSDHTMSTLGVAGPEGNRLSRAVGLWKSVPVDIIIAQPMIGDLYLVCSDGLTKMLPDETIGVVMRNEDEPKAIIERLLFFANSKGGKDNITIIVVRVVDPRGVVSQAKLRS